MQTKNQVMKNKQTSKQTINQSIKQANKRNKKNKQTKRVTHLRKKHVYRFKCRPLRPVCYTFNGAACFKTSFKYTYSIAAAYCKHIPFLSVSCL